jgi:hypothetical protein
VNAKRRRIARSLRPSRGRFRGLVTVSSAAALLVGALSCVPTSPPAAPNLPEHHVSTSIEPGALVAESPPCADPPDALTSCDGVPQDPIALDRPTYLNLDGFDARPVAPPLTPAVLRALLGPNEHLPPELLEAAKAWDWAAIKAYSERDGKVPDPVLLAALYRLARDEWVDFEVARNVLALCREKVDGGPMSSWAELGRLALDEVVTEFARTKDASEARGFFQPLYGTGPDAQSRTQAVLERVAAAMSEQGRPDEGVALLGDVIQHSPPSERCEVQTRRSRLILVAALADQDRVMSAVRDQLDVYRATTGNGDVPKDVKQSCTDRTLFLLAEIASAWHMEYSGTGGVLGTGDPRTSSHAESVYAQLEGFPTEAVSRVFGDAAWVQLQLGDVRDRVRDWAGCGEAYEAALAVNGDPRWRGLARLRAYRCVTDEWEKEQERTQYLDRSWFATDGGAEPFDALDLRMRKHAHWAACALLDEAYEGRERIVEVAARRRRWDLAAVEIDSMFEDGRVKHDEPVEYPEIAWRFQEIRLWSLLNLRESTSGTQRSACQHELTMGKLDLIRSCRSAGECGSVAMLGVEPPPEPPPWTGPPRLVRPTDWREGFGSGHGRLGGSHRTRPPRVRMGSTTTNGRLPPEVIDRYLNLRSSELRACYERALRRMPSLVTSTVLRYVIGRDGSVSQVTGQNFVDDAFRNCVHRAIYRMQFPQPEGGIVTVVRPIHFAPSGIVAE